MVYGGKDGTGRIGSGDVVIFAECLRDGWLADGSTLLPAIERDKDVDTTIEVTLT
jgi:hypothetical protein